MGATKKDLEQMQELSPWEQSQAMDIPQFNLSLNKPNLNAHIQQIIGKVKKGDVNPLEAFIFLNFMQKIADGAKKQLLEQAMIEAEKYPEREAKVYDATVTVKNGAGRYTYPDSIKEAERQAKLAYKASLDGNTITDDDGVVVEPAIYKSGSQTLAITFK